MIRTSLFLGVFASLIPACTSPVEDELGEETTADGEDGKGDATAAFTYYNVFPDTRACSFDTPDCGGYDVSRANRSLTQCATLGGASLSKCKVWTIDWSGTAMPDSVSKSYEQMLHDGTPLLVRGSLVPDPADRGSVLNATEIWVPNRSEWVDGVFTLVKDNGVRCITAPCPSLTERRLNSNLSAQLSTVDLSDSGADADAIERAMGELYDDGLIVVGYRFYDSAGGKARNANKFFTRAPVPLR